MTKKTDITKGEDVSYKWGNGTVEGTVTKVHTDDVEKTIKGSTVKRHASSETPAVEIKTDKGAKVLKSTSELKIG
jgi:hypothetical protein